MDTESEDARRLRLREQADAVRILLPFLPQPHELDLLDGAATSTLHFLFTVSLPKRASSVLTGIREAVRSSGTRTEPALLAAGPSHVHNSAGFQYKDQDGTFWTLRTVSDLLVITHDSEEQKAWHLELRSTADETLHRYEPLPHHPSGAKFLIPTSDIASHPSVSFFLVGHAQARRGDD